MTYRGGDDKVAPFRPLGAHSNKIVGRINSARVLSLGAHGPPGGTAEGDVGGVRSPSALSAVDLAPTARSSTADNILIEWNISCPVQLGDILVGDALVAITIVLVAVDLRLLEVRVHGSNPAGQPVTLIIGPQSIGDHAGIWTICAGLMADPNSQLRDAAKAQRAREHTRGGSEVV